MWCGRTGVLNLGLKFAGLEKRVLNIQSQGKCNWIMQNQPEIWDKTRCYLQVSGFLNHRLTGVFIDSAGSQIGHLPSGSFSGESFRRSTKTKVP